MCSIFGAMGRSSIGVNMDALEILRTKAMDRGRDGGRMERYYTRDGEWVCYLGNWRATPTQEHQHVPFQPYSALVHNGTIANDKQLGGEEGEVDSMVLARVLNRDNIYSMFDSLSRVKGSYAIACFNGNTIFLACNYKPIHYLKYEGAIYFSSMERHFYHFPTFGSRPVQLEPYSILDLRSQESLKLPREQPYSALVVCSGGMDSTTAAYFLRSKGYKIGLLHFNYGCRATEKEMYSVAMISRQLQCPTFSLSIPYSGMDTSSLQSCHRDIAEGREGAEYGHEWVPARNLIMLSMAIGFAEANGYGYVALGNNLEESGVYPDNEEQFTTLMNQVSHYAVQNGKRVEVISPLGNLMKDEIVSLGNSLRVPWELTWSCYRGGSQPCGNCGSCYMRKEAFRRNGFPDPALRQQGGIMV